MRSDAVVSSTSLDVGCIQQHNTAFCIAFKIAGFSMLREHHQWERPRHNFLISGLSIQTGGTWLQVAASSGALLGPLLGGLCADVIGPRYTRPLHRCSGLRTLGTSDDQTCSRPFSSCFLVLNSHSAVPFKPRLKDACRESAEFQCLNACVWRHCPTKRAYTIEVYPRRASTSSGNNNPPRIPCMVQRQHPESSGFTLRQMPRCGVCLTHTYRQDLYFPSLLFVKPAKPGTCFTATLDLSHTLHNGMYFAKVR